MPGTISQTAAILPWWTICVPRCVSSAVFQVTISFRAIQFLSTQTLLYLSSGRIAGSDVNNRKRVWAEK